MESAGLGLPSSRKRDREFKSLDYDEKYNRPSKASRTETRDYASSGFDAYDEERRRQEADLEQDLNVGGRAQMPEPTDDPIGAGFAGRQGGLAAAMSVGAGAGFGRPFGAAVRPLPAARGAIPRGGALGLRGTGADVDPLLGIFPQNGRSHVVRSAGRDAPAAPQSNVVVTVIVAKNIYETRSKVPDEDAIAPLGTEEDFRIMQGEWCFLVAEQRMANRMTMLQDTDIEVISCVNGKSRYERLQFVGMMAGKGSNPADPRSDDHATVQIRGVMSGINTGLETIPPFVPVHFREDPAAVTDSSGHTVPAVAEQGQPPTKFRPPSYPYTEEIISASVARLQLMVDRVWEATRVNPTTASGEAVNMNVAAPPGDGDGARIVAFWANARQEIDNYFNQAQWGREDHPLKIFAKWYAVAQAVQFINYQCVLLLGHQNNDGERDLIYSRFFPVIRIAKRVLEDQERNKHIRHYNAVMGTKVATKFTPNLQAIWSSGMINDSMLLPLPVGLNAWTGSARNVRCNSETFPRIRMELMSYIEAQMVQAVQEQGYKNRLSYGGISLKLAQPGKPLDILR